MAPARGLPYVLRGPRQEWTRGVCTPCIHAIRSTWPEAGAALARCDFYIGNDSGLLHTAAASGVACLGLYGPSWPHLYAPWGEHTGYVCTPQTFDELIDFEGYSPGTLKHSLMTGLSVEHVLSVLEGFEPLGEAVRKHLEKPR